MDWKITFFDRIGEVLKVYALKSPSAANRIIEKQKKMYGKGFATITYEIEKSSPDLEGSKELTYKQKSLRKKTGHVKYYNPRHSFGGRGYPDMDRERLSDKR